MILQNSSQQTKSFNQSSPYKYHFQSSNNNCQQMSNVKRMKNQFHSQIRIRQLEKIKAQRRKIFKVHQSIEQILESDFPKQTEDVKNWAENLAQLYKVSGKYQTDPHKLRDIFSLAERFPNLFTLNLFYLSVLKSNQQNILTLYDIDIWKFLHNILRFPQVKKKQNQENIPQSPPSKNLNANFVQVKLVQVAIDTLTAFYNKDIGFRNYSIQTHRTFSNYLLPAFKKYRQLIKTQVIYFLKAVFYQTPKSYSTQYLSVINSISLLLVEYKDIFGSFLMKKQWKQHQKKESIQEATIRAGHLMGIMKKIMQFSTSPKSKWIKDFVISLTMRYDFSYLVVVQQYLNFVEVLLNDLTMDPCNAIQNLNFLENCFKFSHNTLGFYESYVEAALTDGMQNLDCIPRILQKIVRNLHLLKNCEENHLFVHGQKQLYNNIAKLKQISLFIIDNSLHSDFDKYQLFSREFIFITGNFGKQINLLEQLDYILKTQYHTNIIMQVVRVTFTLLKHEVPSCDVHRFWILNEILQRISDILSDKLTSQQIRLGICNMFLQSFFEIQNKLGDAINFIKSFSRGLNKIESFIYNNQRCDRQFFKKFQLVVKYIKSSNSDQNHNENEII